MAFDGPSEGERSLAKDFEDRQRAIHRQGAWGIARLIHLCDTSELLVAVEKNDGNVHRCAFRVAVAGEVG